jgi:hypothetical protein
LRGKNSRIGVSAIRFSAKMSNRLATQFTNLRRWIVVGVLLLLLILRVVYARNFRLDSDEGQHLHVVWGWTQGMLPYRDFFDNHMPLFHMLSAPIFHWLGVRPDIVVPMRLLMSGLFAFNLWCVWRIGSQFFSASSAALGTLLVAFWPPFFFESLEYRPDNLWSSFWLLALLLIAKGPTTRVRAFLVGLALGAAAAVSMKSVLFLAALLLAGILMLLLVPETRTKLFAWHPAHLLVGLMMVPTLIALGFIRSGAGREFFYCTIQHNYLPKTAVHGTGAHIAESLLAIALAVALARRLIRPGLVQKAPSRAIYLLFTAASYYAILRSCWTIVTPEDYLPFWPALGAIVAPTIFERGSLGHINESFARFVPVALIALELSFILYSEPPWSNKAAAKIGIVADTLRLTSPQDYVLDGKGETIYRPRPVYWIYEGITLSKLSRGMIVDDLSQRLIATRTPLASLCRLHGASKTFVETNYLPVAFRLRALGKMLFVPQAIAEPPPAIHFEIAVPNRYVIVSERDHATGTLDQTPLSGPRELAAGEHVLRLTSGTGRIALIWAQAVDRGYWPFRAIRPDGFETDPH